MSPHTVKIVHTHPVHLVQALFLFNIDTGQSEIEWKSINGFPGRKGVVGNAHFIMKIHQWVSRLRRNVQMFGDHRADYIFQVLSTLTKPTAWKRRMTVWVQESSTLMCGMLMQSKGLAPMTATVWPEFTTPTLRPWATWLQDLLDRWWYVKKVTFIKSYSSNLTVVANIRGWCSFSFLVMLHFCCPLCSHLPGLWCLKWKKIAFLDSWH